MLLVFGYPFLYVKSLSRFHELDIFELLFFYLISSLISPHIRFLGLVSHLLPSSFGSFSQAHSFCFNITVLLFDFVPILDLVLLLALFIDNDYYSMALSLPLSKLCVFFFRPYLSLLSFFFPPCF